MGELLDDQKETLSSLNLKEAELKPQSEILPELLSNLEFNQDLIIPWYGRKG